MWLGADEESEAGDFAEEMEVGTRASRDDAEPAEAAANSGQPMGQPLPDDMHVEPRRGVTSLISHGTASSASPAGTSLTMPRSPELDEAMAALDALAHGAHGDPAAESAEASDAEPTPPEAPPQVTGGPRVGDEPVVVDRRQSDDEIVPRLGPEMTSTGHDFGSGAEFDSGEESVWFHERRSPAARAYRRLRRIFPS